MRVALLQLETPIHVVASVLYNTVSPGLDAKKRREIAHLKKRLIFHGVQTRNMCQRVSEFSGKCPNPMALARP
jgi:hypothetical protein